MDTRATYDVDVTSLDLQIQKMPTALSTETGGGSVCLVCGQGGGVLLKCPGPRGKKVRSCGQQFHVQCLNKDQEDVGRCPNCQSDHVCSSCQKLDKATRKCSQCPKFYHEGCVSNRLAVWKEKTFTCPLHVCSTCVSTRSRSCSDPLYSCVRCPTAYHGSNLCLPAGSHILDNNLLICPGHLKAVKTNSQHARVNMKQCVECGKGENLKLCHSCPAAYHPTCGGAEFKGQAIDTEKLSETLGTQQKEIWLCPHCVQGRKLLYGDIVWIKLGFYRWWPGEICHPLTVPKKVAKKSHRIGEFPVRFFGENVYCWSHQGRVYPFEGASYLRGTSTNGNLDKDYNLGLREAIAASSFVARLRQEQNEKVE
ncbi:histone-lysine N-methyltransferase NSD2-like [Physella acuta]|uniref:histone-lysine N-methyltransferase NSD2-like n=1 Tax=Physella acuta TaxID=109671 RepID=UPI0027DCBC04|nr:histone-lysine N-methyltransferase NSD2-like [Physella acuta]